jgi:hypothetical protein
MCNQMRVFAAVAVLGVVLGLPVPTRAAPTDVATLENFDRPDLPLGGMRGWTFLYNATGPLGTNVDQNYQPLTLQGGQFAGPGGAAPVVGKSTPNPAEYSTDIPIPLSQVFVRPGQGTAENTGGFERAAIVAYTFRPEDFTAAGVTGSQAQAYITYFDFAVSNLALPDGMSARVFHDADPKPIPGLDFSMTAEPFPFPFPAGFRFQEILDPDDIPVGTYSVGDTLYIALGANALSPGDNMRLNFTLGLEAVPEPASVALLAPLALLLVRRRAA